MIKVQALLAALRRDGVRLWTEDGRLHYHAPKGAMTEVRLSQIRELKSGIIEFLQQAATAAAAATSHARPLLQPARPRPPRIPLSYSQERLWLLEQIETLGAAYNIPAAVRLSGHFDEQAFERALCEIVRRHESLRTRFAVSANGDGSPEQVIDSPDLFRLERIDLSALELDQRSEEAGRLARRVAEQPFDLARGPLFRAALLRLAPDEHVAVATMHHIVSDGWSRSLLISEIGALYAAYAEGRPSPLPELPIQYADYALWQRSWLRGEALERQIRYWKDRLAGAPAALDLPTDRPRPPVQNFRGASLSLALPKVLSDDLDALARREGATLFMVLLAAFQIVLSRWSGQQDIVVGTPVAGRTDRQTEGLIGFFVNMLALRADLAGDPSFRDFLGRVKETALGAYAHQDLPFEKLVEELNPARDLSRPPVFQVLFALQNYPEESLTLSSLRLDRIAAPADSVSSKLDLSIYMSESAAGLFGAIEYASDLFEPATIERLAGHFQTVLEGIAATPAARLSELPLLSEAERRRLVVEWNATAADCSSDKCIHDLIAEQAVRRPDAVAVVASGTGEALSYGELNARADRLAHYLQSSLGVGPDVVVGLCMARSPAMLVGLLGILKAGGAYLPLDPTYPRDRLAFMLSNSGAELVLADADLAAAVELPTSTLPVLDLADAAVAERLAAMPDGPATRSRVCPDNLAYVIYTSGSTGAPKGVMVAHRGVVNMLSWLADHVGMTADDAVPQKMPLGFDFSVQELFLPLTAGGRLLLAPPAAAEGGAAEQVQAQLSVGDAATVVSFVPSVLQAWLGSRSPDAGAPTARAVICCGEALPMALVDRLLLSSGWSGALYNLYGPTEASVFATAWNCGEAENGGGEIAPIGRPVWNTQIHVLDERLSPVPVGAVGEICIGGVQLARGYLGQPGLTAERFVPNPFGRGERLYRTGDLAKRRADGVLIFLGRLDDQVKVRGFRIELGEIEAALTALPEVREAVAVAREDRPGEKRLVAYVVGAHGSSELDLATLRAALGRSLPEYMVPSHVVVLDALPLNANGKIDRKALPALDLARGEVDYVAPRSATEEIVAAIWSEILDVDRVGAHDNFFDLGGHSLLATQVMSKLRTAFAIELPLRVLFEAPTVAGLSSRLDAAAKGTAAHEAPPPAIERVGRDDALPLPLSFAQQRLWFLDQFEPGSAFYNMPAAVRLRGVLDVDALRGTLNEVVRRHEALRTCFTTVDGTPVQVFAPDLSLPLVLTDLSGLALEEREQRAVELAREEAATPFDLSRGPLLRASLVRLAERDHILLFTMHHIVSDGWSIGVLVREVATLYGAYVEGRPSPLLDLPIQYGDFAYWQRRYLSGEVLDSQVGYWRKQLSDAPELLALPTDRPRPAVQSYRGATYGFAVPAAVTDGLRGLSRRAGATLFMTLAASLSVLLSRYSGQKDICIGTPIANRTRSELEPLIGFFVNTLVLRTRLDGDPSFDALLKQVCQTALDAYAHQDIPFEHLVDVLNPERHLSHAPLFQVLLALQNAPMGALDLPGLVLETVAAESGTAKFDLSFYFTDADGGLSGMIEYAADLFDAATIERLAGHFVRLLESIVAAPMVRVGELELLGSAERRRLLVEWNATAAEYPRETCIHTLVAEQAARTPDAVAVIYEGDELSYGELNRRSNRLAHHLRGMGVGPDVLVGLCVERSLEMVVGLLGILKAGGAYVPLDPDYPAQRLAYMLEDARPALVLAQERLLDRLPEQDGTAVFCLDRDWHGLEGCPATDPATLGGPQNLAYVIYTSGSTGKPKGVGVCHSALTNFLHAMQDTPGIGREESLLSVTSLSFDIAALELFLPLMVGARLILLDREATGQPQRIAAAIERYRVTLMQATPATWRMLAAHGWPRRNQRLVALCGGEALPAELAAELAEHTDAAWNMYGPTETTIWSAAHRITSGSRYSVPIGRPIWNTQIYVLDEGLEPAPIGVAGELHIAGAGLARGYLGRADLTAEKFIPNPYGTEPGSRMYRTGDLVRWRADGELEFVGRLDDQVKVRGFRIELGEIETALTTQPEVRQAVVLAREDRPGDKRLVAYVVADPAQEQDDAAASVEDGHVAGLSRVWDEIYDGPGRGQGAEDPTFNLAGWTSSYDRQPIPAAEMKEWVEETVAGIDALKPDKVLEIGCGTGLLLHRIAPACSRYWGMDFSGVVLGQLRRELHGQDYGGCDIELLERRAEDFAGLGRDFDTVVLNSVAQYFPSLSYLSEVLEGALERIGDSGGHVFVGDIRHAGLLELFHTSLALHHAEPTARLKQIRRTVAQNVRREAELLVDPGYFFALQQKHPRISHVEILPKRGRSENELTRFRYDVVLSVGGTPGAALAPPAWLRWSELSGGLETVARRLSQEASDYLALRDIPQDRLTEARQMHALLHQLPEDGTAAELRRELAGQTADSTGVSLAGLQALGRAHGYAVSFGLSSGGTGVIHAVFQRMPVQGASHSVDWSALYPSGAEGSDLRRLLAHEPYSPRWEAAFQKSLPQRLRQMLPDYMVPSHVVVLDELPLTANGKIDRKALPAPDLARGEIDYVAPRSATEEIVAAIWSEILGVDRIGAHDNFFDLGGHSLLATQVMSKLRTAVAIELPLRVLFEAPTVAGLSGRLDAAKQEGTGQQAASPPIEPVGREGAALPLSFSQQRLWFLDQLEPGNAFYTMPAAVRLRGVLDVAALRGTLNEIVRRHEALRTRFATVEGTPLQMIAPALSVTLAVIDLGELVPEERERRAVELAREEAATPFDLSAGPLLRASLVRLAERDHILLFTMHHIVSDGWSIGVLVREVAALYGAYVEGRPSPLPDLPIQYADYAHWQRRYLSGAVLAGQVEYWKEQLSDAPELLALPTDRPRPAVQSYRGATYGFDLPVALTSDLHTLSRRYGATLFMSLVASLNVLLSRYSGQKDICIGTPIANRTRSELEPLIGFFVNTLVLRTRLDGDPSFEALLEQVRQTALDAYAHQDVPFEHLVDALKPVRDLSHTPLFQVMLVLQNAPMGALDLPGLVLESVPADGSVSKFDLTLYFTEWGDGHLQGTIEYATDLFDAATIARLAGHFRHLLESIVARPETRVGRLDLLGETERRRILKVWDEMQPGFLELDDAGLAVPLASTNVLELFERAVQANEAAIAVSWDGRTLSYGELDARSNQVANCLLSSGAPRASVVAVMVENPISHIVAILGVMKAGCVFLSLDPAHPDAALRENIELASPQWLVSVASCASRLVDLVGDDGAVRHLVYLDQPARAEQLSDADSIKVHFSDRHASIKPSVTIQGDDPCYLYFTSGSTGKPKAILGRTVGLAHFIQWEIETFGPGAFARVSQFTVPTFDAYLRDIFSAFCSGGTVCIPPSREVFEPVALADWIERTGITVVHCVPTVFRLLLNGRLSPERFPQLRFVLMAGEMLLPSDVNRWIEVFGERIRLINLYGATETTLVKFCYRLPAIPISDAFVPVGRPMSGTQAILLSDGLEPCEPGAIGELYIRTPYRSLGYYNRPDLNDAAFIPNPFTRNSADRLYKTGDFATVLPDGNFRLLGRTDSQVKIRGMRVEPAEIEAAIAALPGVREAVVVAREYRPGDKRLIAYMVAQAGSGGLDVAALRGALGQTLPDHMVPSHFVVLDELPQTSNGKVDRKALPAPDLARGEAGYVASRNETEEIVAGIWSEVLGVDRVGVHDNFFELGGHSLLGTQVIAKVRTRFAVDLPLRTLFEAPTVAGMSERLNDSTAGKDDAHSLAVLLPLRTQGSRPPLFCIHPVSGLAWPYAGLIRHLPEHPLYGLQARGLTGAETLATSIDAMAVDYLAEIRSVQPAGPYNLLGWSFGSLVAHRIATMLQEQGQKVALLGMLDGYPPKPDRQRFNRQELIRYLLTTIDLDQLDLQNETLPWDDIKAALRRFDDPLADFSEHDLLIMLDVMHNLSQLGSTFHPDRFHGDIVLFVATRDRDPTAPTPEAWRPYVTGEIVCHPVDCTHMTMADPGALAEIGSVLAATLDEIEQTARLVPEEILL